MRQFFSQLHNHLQPGDKMVMSFNKNPKPSWLQSQQNGTQTQQGSAGGGQINMGGQPPTSQPASSPAPDMDPSRQMLLERMHHMMSSDY